ncbi:molybdate-anion transporter [Nilaparvata lugens]|uniref:molybdate-anion transporter n=1 Tax=Nilaparvata lugens TaxID=108931 RepID=UPI000B99A46E|nr:molybdate-anion transporter [Nilaparvata lugens]XP_022192540.1 molybdate-anion transporter [Nilaparvata lugens]
MLYLGTIAVLLLITAALMIKMESANSAEKDNTDYRRLQTIFLLAFQLASFSDWLQGPYIYELYHDYGYDEDMIAVLYITGFASSSLFGTLVGYLADKFGRKPLCMAYGILYSICCLTKLSANFYVLMIGRVFGGISTSILFSAFEAWYVNEHVNFFNLPDEWLHLTFSKANIFSGLLAIVAGFVADSLVKLLNLSSVAPFIAAIPFLLISSYCIFSMWTEHTHADSEDDDQCFVLSSLKYMFCEDRMLLLLGFIQSAFESVMYIFIFSWTPVLSSLKPPLGLVFAIFMMAYMLGSRFYNLFTTKRFRPELLLLLTCEFALLCFVIITLLSLCIYFLDWQDVKISTIICYICFILYEVSIGMYYPVIGYLRGRVIQEKYRTSVTNWFRFPMNVFTCLVLVASFGSQSDNGKGFVHGKKFPIIFSTCSILLFAMTVACAIFCRKFSQRYHVKPVVAMENMDPMATLKSIKRSDSIEF